MNPWADSMDIRAQQLRRQRIVKTCFFVALIFFLIGLVLFVENLLLSTALAIVISYLCAPAVSALERAQISRGLATFSLFLIITLGFAVLCAWLVPLIADQIGSAYADLPKYFSGFSSLLDETELKISHFVGGAFQLDLSQQLETKLYPKATAFFEHLPIILSQLLTTLVLAPFMAFFLIKDGRRLSRLTLSLVPNAYFEPMLQLFHQINQQMGQFVRARLLESIIVGLVVWAGLFIIGFPHSPLLALFAALTNLIPYVGPIIGAVPAILIAYINGLTSLDNFLLVMVYFIAQLIDTVFIIPLVVAKIVDLHPVTVIIVIILGFQILGVIGMLISIPVASAFKVTLGTVYRLMTENPS